MVSRSTWKTTTSTTAEYYISFFEACDRLVKPDGRIGMFVPWSFMFRKVLSRSSAKISSAGVDRLISSLSSATTSSTTRLSELLVGSYSELRAVWPTSKTKDGDVHSGSQMCRKKKKSKVHRIVHHSSNRRSNDCIENNLSEFDMVPGTRFRIGFPLISVSYTTAETVLRCR